MHVLDEQAETVANNEYIPHRFGDTPAWFAAAVRLAKRALEAEAELATLRSENERLKAELRLADQEQEEKRAEIRLLRTQATQKGSE